ncbi:MAG: PEP-CTERM sorting domain-containing protein [Pirellulales bacterium]
MTAIVRTRPARPVAIRRGLFGLVACTLAICLAGLPAAPASAAMITLGFASITNNDPTDAAIGEAQMFVDITDEGVSTNQVKFIFRNIGPEASSICDVYFDDGTLLGIASIVNGTGVKFSQGASPPLLPGGNSLDPPFEVTAGFLADSDAPVMPNGVNPNEQLAIIFNLKDSQGYASVLHSLLLAGADDGLRIGIRVQGYESGGSESFVNHPVPEPSSLALCGAAMLSLAGFRRFRPGLAGSKA